MERKSQEREAEPFTTLVPMYQYSQGAAEDKMAFAAVKVAISAMLCSHLWCPSYLRQFDYTRNDT